MVFDLFVWFVEDGGVGRMVGWVVGVVVVCWLFDLVGLLWLFGFVLWFVFVVVVLVVVGRWLFGWGW